jgi:Aspartyl protease
MYVPPLRFVPFPQRLVKSDLVQQFGKVGEWMRKLNLTVPFVNAITQMPAYANCLKEILSKNKGLKEVETVILNDLPPKLKDPVSFTIPCSLGNIKFKNALCDLGASVSLMPRSVFERLGIGDLKPTNISLQMADGSVRLPIGILEGIPIQVGKFFIPIDFVICDMKEDPYIPIILGRPFLIITGAKIDVKCGKISLNFGNEKVEFSAIKIHDNTLSNDSCCRVEVFNHLTEEKHNEIMKEESRKTMIKHDDSVSTGRAKDKGFQAAHKKLQMICETDWLSALQVKKK